MTTILPSIRDKYRNNRKSRRYVGQVLIIDGGKTRVIAEVYGETMELMRKRKHAIAKLLDEMENTRRGRKK